MRDRRVHARAPGKINVFFAVGDVQPDGYHDVASVYQAVSLYEDVWAQLADEFSVEVTGSVDVAGVPLDGRNLAVRAARLVARATEWEGGIHLEIRKGVPVAGGMGGGSADAAATLLAVNELLGGDLGPTVLHELGAELGVDVPFALHGGTAVGIGRGDELAPALARGRFDWVLVTRTDGLSTPGVYAQLDRLRAQPDIRPHVAMPTVDPAVLAALRAGDAVALSSAITNDLQPAACSLMPDLTDVIALGTHSGALASLVSGSGPTLAFLAPPEGAGALATAMIEAGHTAIVAHGPVAGARVLD
ncbi:4-(cytidine 5'-diphospho)-2-C-methyl-D-erythritol kinase [Microbacterium sp.]|uniref:4-(cytidine 5'-diphospho)-2-C-methyl-D-erythritol kinase n=1 Tax=Microbacterium sp. TaxID=51671 RepID=UPI0025F36AA1|nr:4-(cytidine 5'-diphospho)-2-C-methyl-D-erythritol kinase [Microbacterium sp.]